MTVDKKIIKNWSHKKIPIMYLFTVAVLLAQVTLELSSLAITEVTISLF